MYQLKLTSGAQRQLDKVPADDLELIAVALKRLGDNPSPSGVKKLKGSIYRIRVGDWRIIYVILDKGNVVLVGKIARRSEETYDRVNDLF